MNQYSIGDHIKSLDYGRKRNILRSRIFSLFELSSGKRAHFVNITMDMKRLESEGHTFEAHRSAFIIASTEQGNNIPTATFMCNVKFRKVPSVLALAIGLPALEGPIKVRQTHRLEKLKKRQIIVFILFGAFFVLYFRSSTHAFSESSTVNNHGARASSCP